MSRSIVFFSYPLTPAVVFQRKKNLAEYKYIASSSVSTCCFVCQEKDIDTRCFGENIFFKRHVQVPLFFFFKLSSFKYLVILRSYGC